MSNDFVSFEKSAAEHRKMLDKIRNGGIATGVRIIGSKDSCPACKALHGAYEFDEVPELPIEGCSHEHGCRCHYEPVLDRRGP
ncbi:MAG: hypothetical protein Kow0080_10800 [Candidatus Promineifilaceae bacterium]